MFRCLGIFPKLKLSSPSHGRFFSTAMPRDYGSLIEPLPKPPIYTPAIQDLLDPEQFVFVDTTANLPQLCQKGASLFIAPRRFGKSTLLGLRQAYLELKNDDASKLFKGLEAGKALKASIANEAKPRKPVPVIRLNLAIDTDVSPLEMRGIVNNQLLAEADRLGVANFKSEPVSKETLRHLINQLAKKGQPPAVHIDELDYSLVASLYKKESIATYDDRLDFLKSIFSLLKESLSKGAIHSIFAVGITQVGWRGLSTAANNLKLLSFLPHQDRPQIGYTWQQIERHFGDHIDAYVKAHTPSDTAEAKQQVREKLKKDLTDLYHGYCFHPSDKEPLYNPWSINNFFRRGSLKPYWALSTAAAWLTDRIDPSVVKSFLQASSPAAFSIDENDLQLATTQQLRGGLAVKEQAAILVQTGDLAIQQVDAASSTWKVRIPNEEVRSIVFPRLLSRIFGLDEEKLMSLKPAVLLQNLKVDEFFQYLVDCGLQLPANHIGESTAHASNEYPLPDVVAYIVQSLAMRFPSDFHVPGPVCAEAHTFAGTTKRVDVAFTIKKSAQSSPDTDTTLLWEFKTRKSKKIGKPSKGDFDQLAGYMTALKNNPLLKGQIKGYVVVFSQLNTPDRKLSIRVYEYAPAATKLKSD